MIHIIHRQNGDAKHVGSVSEAALRQMLDDLRHAYRDLGAAPEGDDAAERARCQVVNDRLQRVLFGPEN